MTKKTRSAKTREELAALPKKRKRLPEPEAASAPAIIEPDLVARVMSPAQRHNRRLAERARKPKEATPANARELLERMRAGEMPVEICDAPHMPHYSAFVRLLRTDEQFAIDYSEAYEALANAVLEDGAAFARDTTELANIDAQRIADVYLKSAISALEKLSPKTHGVLVKHAGADGGALTVQVLDYAKQTQIE